MFKSLELVSIHFPNTDWTDRTFGVIDPKIHSDIALTFAKNWKSVTGSLFGGGNVVYAYSLLVPVNLKKPGNRRRWGARCSRRTRFSSWR